MTIKVQIIDAGRVNRSPRELTPGKAYIRLHDKVIIIPDGDICIHIDPNRVGTKPVVSYVKIEYVSHGIFQEVDLQIIASIVA